MKRIIMGLAVVVLLAAAAYAATSFFGLGRGGVEASNTVKPAMAASAKPAEVAAAQAGPDGLLYIIYDSSNSMWGELEDQSRKYEAGRRALSSLLASPINREYLAFRAYGHRRPGDCSDSEMIVAPASPADAGPKITAAMETMRPTGKTPISASLRASLADFGDRKGDILLISDGIETCDIDPCALMEEWRDKGVSVRVHVVGVGLNDLERKAMMCVAETGGGKYFDAGSEAELAAAINEASKVAADAEPIEKDKGFALKLNGTDETGRAFIIKGDLIKNGKKVGTVSSVGRNPIDGAGDYVVKAGVLLADGSIYKPVSANVTIADPGTTVLDMKVTRPAIVSAKFSEDGEEHRGSFVTAYQNGKKAFGFRAFDEALARPGSYDFRSNPNQDNELKVAAALVEGQHKILNFDLQKTVKFTLQFRQPDGKIIRRNSSLSRGGKKIYFVHSNNGGRAVPGTYRVHMEDAKIPLTKRVDVTIKSEGQKIIVDLPAAMLTINYVGEPDNFLKKPNRAFVEGWDAQKKKFYSRTYTRIDVPVAFAPGRYRVIPYSYTGYFDPVEITLASGESKTVKLVAKPLGKVVLRYDPASTFKRKPDRAFIRPLDGQRLVGCNCRLDKAHKVPPGRYRAEAHYVAGEFAKQIITVRAGQTTTVTFTNR